jgi:hypothetical protein
MTERTQTAVDTKSPQARVIIASKLRSEAERHWTLSLGFPHDSIGAAEHRVFSRGLERMADGVEKETRP